MYEEARHDDRLLSKISFGSLGMIGTEMLSSLLSVYLQQVVRKLVGLSCPMNASKTR